MRFVVVGCGRVGAGLVRQMAVSGHSVAVIDRNASAFDRLPAGFDGARIEAMALDESAWESAGVERCDGLAAVTGTDDVNAVVGRLAAKRFGVPRVVARMYDPVKADVYRRFGVHTVSPAAWAVSRLAALLLLVDVGTIASLGSGNLDLVEVVVPGAVAGARLGDLEMPGEIRAAAVTRTGRSFIPDSGAHVHAGDIVTFVVSVAGAERLEAMMGRTFT
ncbi:MAG: TrkA family potassium uptake protein [Acidimicrobiia bacterium]|nr:TrkA family potassium uptake protein [Acidimicrobiia bacterium]MDH5522110.1 TrkA family potassium uptake protein [Acidimicrobiia bacterium]